MRTVDSSDRNESTDSKDSSHSNESNDSDLTMIGADDDWTMKISKTQGGLCWSRLIFIKSGIKSPDV